MITEELNTRLIDAVKQKLPSDTNVANLLMDTLYIGKEAVYRRLRGEVPFTLAEAAMVSQKLGISLDRLIGASFSGNALFDLNMLHSDDPVKSYYDIVERYVELFKSMKDDPKAELNTSSNIIPQTLYLKYSALSKFRLFKWIYQHAKDNCEHCYEDLVLPQKLLDKKSEWVNVTQHFTNTQYIMDELVFQYLADDIKYFISIHLLTEDDVRKLKEEMLDLLYELEIIATTGKFVTGHDVQIYISNVNFEATYSYVESKFHKISLIRVFSINSITSIDPEVFGLVKDWIQSLKKYATLISHSGEMQRRQFFKKQRDIVESIG